MSGTYGFGLSSLLPATFPEKARDELLGELSSLGLMPAFHELRGHRVLRIEHGKGGPKLRFLSDAEAAPIVAACKALGAGDDGALATAPIDQLMTFTNYGDVLLPGYRPTEDEELVELDFPDTVLDGLCVGGVDTMLEDIRAGFAERSDAASKTAGTAPAGSSPAEAAADGLEGAGEEEIEAERAEEESFARRLAAVLEVCRTHKLLLSWSPDEKP